MLSRKTGKFLFVIGWLTEVVYITLFMIFSAFYGLLSGEFLAKEDY